MAEESIDQGLNSAKNLDLEAAQEKFQQAYQLDTDNVNLTELTTEANQLAAQEFIDQRIDQVKQGNVAEAITFYDQAQKIDPNLEIESDSWNLLCWFGSIYRYASEVLDACEKAVALADEESKAGHLDSRGLARALTGNTQGAIEDFQAFIDSSSFHEELRDKRKEWIESLKNGENPFTDEVLEDLKD